MKILKHRNIMGCLYALLLAMPFIAIGVRCAYVALNKNAYQSYYGETINQSENVYLKYYELENNKSYYVNQINLQNPYGITVSENKIYVSNITNVIEASQHDFTNVKSWSIYNNGSALNFTFYFYDATSTYLFSTSAITSFEFTYLSSTETNSKLSTFVNNNNFIFKLQYNDYSYMDNVFEYSVNKFIEDNNFGKVNFFQWTTDIFFDSNQVNNMYVHYINWYFNYALLMSTTYILFLVLMWFVNFARRLLERGMNYDF